LSTSASQAELAPTWKEEVNRRLAAHKSRKGPSLTVPARPAEAQHGASSLAAQAAARVAARYAKAPSYSEMLADEARAAVRAAEAASRAALHAQAAAESILAGLEAVSEAEPPWEPQVAPSRAPEPVSVREWEPGPEPVQQSTPVSNLASERQSFGIRWEPDMPARPAESAAYASTNDWWESSPQVDDGFESGGIVPVEPAQPIHANLIEFPREIVATRKVRSRAAEGAGTAAAEAQGQLSIFEVDPEAIMVQPAMAEAMAVPDAPEWSGMELEAQPQLESAPAAPAAAVQLGLQQAPLGLRLMAAVVDGTLILGAFMAAVLVAASNLKELPSLRMSEMGAAAALLVVGMVYQALFFTLGEATPGMKYAQVSLCTFDDQSPTRAQRCSRMGALLLSLLPLGLGVAWALFDDDRLSWHDRLSKTYLRRC
jgi:uncharacterized RDD family membrane protein YckC